MNSYAGVGRGGRERRRGREVCDREAGTWSRAAGAQREPGTAERASAQSPEREEATHACS